MMMALLQQEGKPPDLSPLGHIVAGLACNLARSLGKLPMPLETGAKHRCRCFECVVTARAARSSAPAAAHIVYLYG
jgi:hypothetical protein